VRSIRYRGLYFKIPLAIFVVSFLALGYLGTVHVTTTGTLLARFFAVCYFLFFLLMPIYSKMDKTQPVPERIK
jgi:ubiquinol-cytochrome c reductase cytochrome b subunit